VIFHVSFTSGKPVYLQLTDQVRSAAASGAVRSGDPLPSIREVAEQLRVNRNTVAKAYAELESQGVIETAPGKGCFVREVSSPLRKDARRKVVSDALDEAAVKAHHSQLDRTDFLRLAEERYDALEHKRARAAATAGRS
jgi:GntR family transcriptional regulator